MIDIDNTCRCYAAHDTDLFLHGLGRGTLTKTSSGFLVIDDEKEKAKMAIGNV